MADQSWQGLRGPEEVLLTVHDVAKILKISVSAVYQWIDEGRMSYIDLGARGRRRVVRFSPSDIDDFISERHR
jgi:excisionase family DNA binding protein